MSEVATTNTIRVRIVQFGKPIDPVKSWKTFDAGREWTVGDVLNHLNINPAQYSVQMGGEPASLDAAVRDEQTLTLFTEITGN